MDRCDHSDLPADQCGCHHCRPNLSLFDLEIQTTDITWSGTANYAGRCGGCDKRIQPGDTIARARNVDGYICAACNPRTGDRSAAASIARGVSE